MFVGTWWSLMPPIVAIALALLTKEVYLSLFAGCALGALLAAEFHPWIAFDTLFNTMIDSVDFSILMFATVYKGNIIKNLIMDCQSYTKYRPNETTGGIFVSWRRKEELPTGA